MALISCAECQKEISDKAAVCPHCGNPSQDLGSQSPKIRQLLSELNLFGAVYCGNEEQKQLGALKKQKTPLPEDVKEDNAGMFYREKKATIDERALRKFILLQQTSYLKTIKNCLVFFTALTIVGMIAILIALRV